MKIRDVLNVKGDQVVMTSPDSTVRDLAGLLAEHNIGAVLVSSDESPVAGIVSERDVVRHLAGRPDLLEAPVSEIMTADVHTAGPDDTVESLRVLMTRHRIRHVPVVDSGELMGLVSIGDVVKSSIEALKFEKEQLETYVSSGA